MPSPDLAPALMLLEHHYGFRRFRPAQVRVIRAILAGGDVLAVLPTGAGKSICFQVPALLDRGLTLVVSPLISLMQDQVAGAARRRIPAGALTGVMSASERLRVARSLRAGELRLLYVSPERLHSRMLRRLLDAIRVSILTVDEAHCISEWGHDFRPSYRRIAAFRKAVGSPPCVALTATATPETREDIVRSLRLGSPRRIVASVNRSNLRWEVERADEPGRAVRTMVDAVRAEPGPSIVYVATREGAVRAAEALLRFGIRVAPYHAGLPPQTRTETQERFLSGKLRAVCATSAFGMGIDHPSVRLVCHLGIPGSLEAYVQQAGRAGRDSGPARCLLVMGREDGRVQRRLIRQSWPGRQLLSRSLAAMPPGPVRFAVLKRSFPHVSEAEMWSAFRMLEEFGCVRRLPPRKHGDEMLMRGPPGCRRLIDFEAPRRGASRALGRLGRMEVYAKSRECRRASIARYFGERPPRCTGCDRCG